MDIFGTELTKEASVLLLVFVDKAFRFLKGLINYG